MLRSVSGATPEGCCRVLPSLSFSSPFPPLAPRRFDNVFVFRLSVMSITDPISCSRPSSRSPANSRFCHVPTAALAPSIVIRRRRTRSGSRTSPAFARRRHSYSASLGFFGGCPGAPPRRGGGRERGEVAGGAWCGGSGGRAEAGAERPPRPPSVGGVAARPMPVSKVEAHVEAASWPTATHECRGEVPVPPAAHVRSRAV